MVPKKKKWTQRGHLEAKKGLRNEPQPLDFAGGPYRNRTYNLLIKSQMLYQLS